jgi:hypothetical protein
MHRQTRLGRFTVILLLSVAAGGCYARYAGTSTPQVVESYTWNGRQVEIVESNDGSSSRGTTQSNQRMEINLDGHQVVLTEKTISLDGEKTTYGKNANVSIRNDGGNVSVYIDDEYALP